MKTPCPVAMRTVLLCLAVSACGGQIPGSIVKATAASPEPVSCEKKSWVAGTTELCSGKLIYRDYIYDDYGAESTIPGTPPAGAGALAASAGEARYPAGAENTADLVRFELSLDGDAVEVEFELNALYSATQTIAALAIDTDNNPATGTETLLGHAVNGADFVQQFNEGDPATNLIRGRFARPKGDTWKIWAVLAQSDGTVMNVAFRGADEQTTTGSFWEDQQALALGQNDISAFAVTVNLAELEQAKSQSAEIKPGFHQRVYTSAYTLEPGEGVSVDGVPGRHGRTSSGCEQFFHYLGKYQPYGFYLPAKPGPYSLVVQLHGCDDNHSSQISSDGFQRQFGEDLNRIIVSPLGRGSVGWFSDISERDVLDVMNDTLNEYHVDPDQVIVSGYSMGGYGAIRMAAFYPDLFAAAVSWVGNTGSLYNTPLPGNPMPGLEEALGVTYTELLSSPPPSGASGAIGNVIDFVGNLNHVPFVGLYSGGDYLVPVTTALTLLQRLMDAKDVVYDFYLHPAAEHLTYALLDSWQKEADFTANRKRIKNPMRVVYRTDASLDYPEYAIRHDRAYWVSEIAGRGEGYVDVDLKSQGCGHAEPQFTTGQDSGVGPVPLAWLRSFRQISGETASEPQNRIEGRLANVSSLSIDARSSCVSPGTVYSLMIDGPVQLRFSDGRRLELSKAGLNEGVVQ